MRVLLLMKQQINWQEPELNIRSQDLNQLGHLSWSCQEGGQGLDERKSQKTLEIHNWTQTGKGTYIWTLCQKNEGSVKIKQRPVKMGGRTTYWTLPPKMTPSRNGVDRRPNL
jgi:hypothetical protein